MTAAPPDSTPTKPAAERRSHRGSVGRPSTPPSALGLPDPVSFWLRWLGFCSLLVVLFAFAAHAVEPASGPSWLFLGLQLAAFVGVVAIGVPLLLDGAARIRAKRRNQPRDTPPADRELGEDPSWKGNGDGRR